MYMIPEGKSLHDLFCDWIWDMLTKTAETQGEEGVYRLLRSTQETWMMKRTWKGLSKMSVEERVYVNAEVMRSHRCGPKQLGEIEIIEDEHRYSIKMDPCGSGGRMRRGDPVEGTPSRLGPPYNFGATKRGHPWSWGRKNVPYYCIHCAVNEILPIEWGGASPVGHRIRGRRVSSRATGTSTNGRNSFPRSITPVWDSRNPNKCWTERRKGREAWFFPAFFYPVRASSACTLIVNLLSLSPQLMQRARPSIPARK